MGKKVVLINSPQLDSLDDHLDPPLGLMYIAAVLESRGVQTGIADLSSTNEDQWLSLVPDADIYGFTLLSASFNTSRKIAQMLKSRSKDALIVAGGPHATSLPEATLQYKEFDYVIRGEGEFALPELLDQIEKGQLERRIIQAAQIKDLNSLPEPARHLIDLHSYTREVEGIKATSVITSRGCPNNCAFCCKEVHGEGIRFKSAEKVISEVQGLIDKQGFKAFIFYDDIFTLHRKRLHTLCDAFQEMDISFRCNGRAGVNTLEDYQLLAKAGCKEVSFGIESGSQKMLDKIYKGTTVQQNLRAIQDAKKAGLVTKAFLVVGFPGETQETVNETKKFMDLADPDKFTVFTFVPLPGCDVYKNPAKYGITDLSKDWGQYFNISGQYEGGMAFSAGDLTHAKVKELHDDLVGYLLKRKGRAYGQTEHVQPYYKLLVEKPGEK